MRHYSFMNMDWVVSCSQTTPNPISYTQKKKNRKKIVAHFLFKFLNFKIGFLLCWSETKKKKTHFLASICQLININFCMSRNEWHQLFVSQNYFTYVVIGFYTIIAHTNSLWHPIFILGNLRAFFTKSSSSTHQ